MLKDPRIVKFGLGSWSRDTDKKASLKKSNHVNPKSLSEIEMNPQPNLRYSRHSDIIQASSTSKLIKSGEFVLDFGNLPRPSLREISTQTAGEIRFLYRDGNLKIIPNSPKTQE